MYDFREFQCIRSPRDGLAAVWQSICFGLVITGIGHEGRCSALYSFSWGVSESVGGGLILIDGLAGLWSVRVELHELGKIKLGLLENLNLLDEDVLKGEDLGALFGDLFADLVGQAKRVIINL